jgi:hypothetical protein
LDSNHTSYWINRRPAEATSVVVYVYYRVSVNPHVSYSRSVT